MYWCVLNEMAKGMPMTGLRPQQWAPETEHSGFKDLFWLEYNLIWPRFDLCVFHLKL